MTQTLQLPSLVLFKDFCQIKFPHPMSIQYWLGLSDAMTTKIYLFVLHDLSLYLLKQYFCWELRVIAFQRVLCIQMSPVTHIYTVSTQQKDIWQMIQEVMSSESQPQSFSTKDASHAVSHEKYRLKKDPHLWISISIRKIHLLSPLLYSLVIVSQYRQAQDL